MERTDHAACCLNYGEDAPQLLITGGIGRNHCTLKDAWILDMKFGKWREVSRDVSYDGFYCTNNAAQTKAQGGPFFTNFNVKMCGILWDED